MDWPVTSEPSRAKARPLRPRRSCFGPLSNSPVASGPWSSLGFGPNELMVEPPGTAPGSDRFITTPVYRHSRPLRDGTLNIGAKGLRKKSQLGVIPGRPEGPGPESITTAISVPIGLCSILLSRGYGFRARRYAARRNDGG